MKKFFFLLVLFLITLVACAHPIEHVPASKIPSTNWFQPVASITSGGEYTPTVLPIQESIPPVLPPTTAPAMKHPNLAGKIARQHILALSQTIGPRVAGMPGEAEAAGYIRKIWQECGYDVQTQTFPLNVKDDPGQTSQRSHSGMSQNVIAKQPGLSTQEIIVGAHYDSVEVGRGADDNASGVGVMLEVAGMIRGTKTPYTVRFIAFGAEETGLIGSRFYVDNMSAEELGNTVAMINLDSLIAGDITYIYGSTGSNAGLRDWIMEKAARHGYTMQTQSGADLDLPDGTPCDCSDYAPFEHARIPFVYFEATNWNLGDKDGYTQVDLKFGVRGEIWHTKFDRLDYIDQAFPGRIDEHLSLYVTLLYEVLTQFGMAP